MTSVLRVGLLCALAAACSSPGGAAHRDADANASADGDASADGPDAMALAGSTTCASPAPLDPTSTLLHEQLDRATEPFAACGEGAAGALYYAIDVPGGNRLVVRAIARSTGSGWTPRLAAFGACDATSCLARGSSTSGAEQRLNWINNGTSPRHVILAVSADGPVTNAHLDLSVGVIDLFSSCANPVPVHDGTLVNRSLANVQPSATPTCGNPGESALYYAATLLPQQEIVVTTSNGDGSLSAANIGLRTACDEGCAFRSPAERKVNLSAEPQTVLIEVTVPPPDPFNPAPDPAGALFDVQVSLPPPPAGIIVTPTSPLVTTEAGGQATFDVFLMSRPLASVKVGLTSDRPSEGTPSPASLVFDATNWAQPQTVTVTGVDDRLGDGAQQYTIVTAPAFSADPYYLRLDAGDLTFTNLDDDPSLRIEGSDDLVTSEEGATATFTVRLNAAPTKPVTVPLASTLPAEGTVSPASLTFTAADWNVPQVVTLTGVDDGAADGPQPYEIALGPPASGDARYGGLKKTVLVAHNRDDDFQEISTMLVGGTHCAIPGTPNQFPIARDTFGQLYVVLQCDYGLVLFTSTDGGKTFSDAMPIPGTDAKLGGGFAVAAGRGGSVYVAFGYYGRGLQLARSADAGRTWSQRALAPVLPDLLRIGAGRDTVVITGGDNSDGTLLGNLILQSQDGGRSFVRRGVTASQVTALAVQPDGTSVWLVDQNRSLLTSTDGGATFRTAGSVPGPAPMGGCCYVFGQDAVFAISNLAVTTVGFADPMHGETLEGPAGEPFAAALDDANVLTIVEQNGATGNLYATRFGGAGAERNPTIFVPPGTTLAGAVALSRHAVAVAASVEKGAVFTVAVWP